MELFNELRAKARANRDKIIARAKEEYAASLARINELEQDLLGRDRPQHKTLSACVDSTLPRDAPFTTSEIMVKLELLDPKRTWRKRSVDDHITRLRKRGVVRRVHRPSGSMSGAVYIRADVNGKPVPFGDKTLQEAVAQLLADQGPLNVAEVAVKLLEDGYHTTMGARRLRDAVSAVFRKHSARFSQRAGKWALA
jgi:hypothetical protein